VKIAAFHSELLKRALLDDKQVVIFARDLLRLSDVALEASRQPEAHSPSCGNPDGVYCPWCRLHNALLALEEDE
jgi:hypothetical protein